MNWTEIKEKYPNSCYKLEIFIGGHKKDDYSASDFEYDETALWYEDEDFEPQCFSKRRLYDFFDEQKMYIEIKSGYGITKILFSYNITLVFDIDDGFDEDWEEEPCYDTWDTRKEAEEQAFLKAFEILEGQL